MVLRVVTLPGVHGVGASTESVAKLEATLQRILVLGFHRAERTPLVIDRWVVISGRKAIHELAPQRRSQIQTITTPIGNSQSSSWRPGRRSLRRRRWPVPRGAVPPRPLWRGLPQEPQTDRPPRLLSCRIDRLPHHGQGGFAIAATSVWLSGTP